MHASQNGRLDPLGMTEKDEKMITEAVRNLSNVCSKIIVSMNSMTEALQKLFTQPRPAGLAAAGPAVRSARRRRRRTR